MNDRAIIEEAIISLRSGLDLNPDAGEQKFQDWFEKYDRIFSVLGFQKWIAQPVLESDAGEKLIPDFMVQRPNQSWEIFELKTPAAKVLLDKEKRSKFYSSLESYVSQVLEYAEYFDERSNRERFKQKYGIEIQKSLRSTIVVGRNEGLDKAKVHKMRMQRGANVDIVTFDDILEQLEFARSTAYSVGENVRGMSVHILASMSASDGRLQYLFDFGGKNDRNRISAYVKDGAMCFRVLDGSGHPHIVRLKNGDDGFRLQDMNYYVLEMGIVEDGLYLAIAAGGKLYSEGRMPDVSFDFDDVFLPGTNHLHHTLASDMFGWNNAEVRINRLLAYNRTLTFAEKYENLIHFLLGDHGLVGNFDGTGYAASKNHPVIPRGRQEFHEDSSRIAT